MLILSGSLVLFWSCNDNSSNGSPNNQSNIFYKDLKCGKEGLFKAASLNDIELTWSLNQTMLNIELHYMNTCGSAYKDSITYENNKLSVNIRDTSRFHAKCLCEHGTQVALNVGFENKVRLLFSIKPYSEHEYYLKLDTLLVIRAF